MFASDDAIKCDAGNLTYLNVGTRPFASLGSRIAFERWYDVPDAPCEVVSMTGHRYYHRYTLAPSQEGERWRRTQALASRDRVPCGSLTGEQAAREIWLAMRRHAELITAEDSTEPWADAYGISIRVACPPGRAPAPAGTLEAVVDGCLASLHRDTDLPHAARVAAKLATQLANADERDLTEALTGAGSWLFAGPPFRHYPTFVQLSPCDERCLLGSLEVAEDVGATGKSLSGELFAIEPVFGGRRVTWTILSTYNGLRIVQVFQAPAIR